MRLARLDLIRFGRFEDMPLEMPAAEPDLMIVAGRNEAGKTTTMAAVEGLLFGFPARTGYAFRHGYDQLRVGAVIEADGDRVVLRRRKGNRDTLLGEDGAPTRAGEAALNRLLGAMDCAFFRRMFSLSHDRLAEGGRELAAAEGEVGETLFAAGAALRGLRARRKSLDGEATEIWTPRRARSRRFYQAMDRVGVIERALRAGIRRPEEWKALRRSRDAAVEEQRRLDEAYSEAAAEASRASRIRRVAPAVRRTSAVDEELAALEDAVAFPEDAASRVAASKQRNTAAAAEAGVHRRSLEARLRDRDALPPVTALHERQADLGALEEQRVKIAQMRLDLPKRHGERDAAIRDLREAGRDFGWEIGPDESLLERVPSDRQLASLNNLLQRRGAVVEAEKAAATAVADAERRFEEQRSRIASGGRAAEVARLEAVVRANASASDLEMRQRELRRRCDDLRDKVAGLRAGLAPTLPDDVAGQADLRRLPIPGAEEIARFRDRFRDIDERREEAGRRLADERRLLRRDQERRRELERAAAGISRSSLDQARAGRDAAWERVKARLLNASGDDASVPGGRLAERFEGLAGEADGVADRRFERAETAGRLAAAEAAIQDRESSIEDLRAEEGEIGKEREGLTDRWRSLWKGCPFDPLPPDRMAVWADTRDELAAAYGALGSEERSLSHLEAEERDTRAQFASALLPFGVGDRDVEPDPLRVLLRRAEARVQEERQAEQRENDARAALDRAEEEWRREQDRLERARGERAAWETEWSETVAGAGLDPIAPAEALVGLLTNMRVSATKIRDVVHRIGRMSEDIASFEETVRGLVSTLAPELAELAADEAALRLRDRLHADVERRRERRELDQRILELESSIREAQEEQEVAATELKSLHELAGTADLATLESAIERSDRKRALELERSQLLDQLDRDADGLSLPEVQAECEGIGPDEASARESVADARLGEIAQERSRLAERLGETRKELEAFADDDAAARLAANHEEALTALRAAAERYARVRSAEILLRWALERFRRENQGPMLRRAGAVFHTLTGGSFTDLRVGFDSKDQLQLEAVRDGGEVVPVSGLSSGSEDQLFLALRVAAIEEYVGRAPAPPFIADDLFLNFDDERAAAGFRVLGGLARKIQVLFFTHHEHLVAIARRVLGEGVPVVRLEEG